MLEGVIEVDDILFYVEIDENGYCRVTNTIYPDYFQMEFRRRVQRLYEDKLSEGYFDKGYIDPMGASKAERENQ